MKNTLVAISYSPWSVKARWALDHHGVAYRFVEYLPLVGEPLLRLAARRLRGRVSVPVLFVDGRVLGDSLDIVRHADGRGFGTPLLPARHEAEILRWHAEADAVMDAGRARTTARLMSDPEALVQSAPRGLPTGWARPLARTGVRFINRKYGADDAAGARYEALMAERLEAFRAALGGRDHVVGDALTVADIAMACALNAVSPADPAHIPLTGAARRAAWTEPALAERFADLIAWRDRLLERHMPPRART